jgi:DNA-binding transcriptional LysR family regulator
MELNHLRCFYEVAKAGGFSFAAKKLHVSQSSLSKAVATLEAREGVLLLERSKKGVALTPLGQDIFNQCQSVFSQLQDIKDLCQGGSQKCEGPLRFGCSDHLARYLMVTPVQKFRERYEKVRPSIFVGAPNEVVAKLLNNEIEFGLFFSRVKATGLEYKRIAPFETILVSPEKMSGRNKLSDTLAKGITGSISKEFERHPSHRLFEFAEKAPVVNIEANSQELQKQFCLAGQGSALLAKFMVKDELKQQLLYQVPLPNPIYFDLLLVKRKGAVLSRPAQVFIDEAASRLKDA